VTAKRVIEPAAAALVGQAGGVPKTKILVVDDDPKGLFAMRELLGELQQNLMVASSGEEALELALRHDFAVILLDVQMPHMDGYEVCRRIKAGPRGRLLPVVMITALDRTNDRVKALESGADDFMSKPVERVELVARVRSALRLKALYDTLDSAEQVIFALAAAVEAKDSYTEKHTARVAETARLLGARLGLPQPALDALYRGGLVHDIGKIGVPDAILLKPGPLNAQELAVMRTHPALGESIVKPLRSGTNLLPIIRNHHEHFDGTGYPDGLRGQQIPRLARIVSVCDAYDAMVTDRPYRLRRSLDEATAVMTNGAGKQWDPDVVKVLVAELPAIRQVGAA